MENLTKDVPDYYEIGDSKNIVLSSSTLKYIMPLEGGSFQTLKDALDNKLEKISSKSLETGSMLHDYIECPEEFKICPIDKPSEVMGEICDELVEVILTDFLSVVNNNIELQLEDWLSPMAESTTPEYGRIEYLISGIALNIWESKGYYNNWKSETKVNKIKEVIIPYVKEYLFLQNIEKVNVVSKAVKQALEIGIQNARNCYFRKDLAFLEEDILAWQSQGWEIYKELPIYFTIRGVKFKSKLDIVKIHRGSKVIVITDAKSYGKPGIGAYPYSFKYYKTYRQLTVYKKAVLWLLDNQGENILEWKIKVEIAAISVCKEGEAILFNKIPNSWFERGNRELEEAISRVQLLIEGKPEPMGEIIPYEEL